MRERNCRYRAASSSQKRSLADPSHPNNPCSFLPEDAFKQIVEELSDCEDVINLCHTNSECQEACQGLTQLSELWKSGLSKKDLIWNCLLSKISNLLQDEELTKKVFPPGWRWDRVPSQYTETQQRNLHSRIRNEKDMEAFWNVIRKYRLSPMSDSVVMSDNEKIPSVPGVTLQYGDYFFEYSHNPWIATKPLQMIMNLNIESNTYFMTIRNPDLKELVMRAFRMKGCTAEPYKGGNLSRFTFTGEIPDLKGKTMRSFLLENFPFLRQDLYSRHVLREKVEDPSLPKDFLKRISIHHERL